MKRVKTNKAITLVALIITIVILLILAVVTINDIGKNGIIEKSNNVATRFNTVKEQEAEMYNNYLLYLKQSQCNHTFVDGVCTWCGYELEGDGGTEIEPDACTHTGTRLTGYAQISGNNKEHTVAYSCENCGEILMSDKQNHDWNDEIGKCRLCGYPCTHGSLWNTDEEGNVKCSICGYECEHDSSNTVKNSLDQYEHQIIETCSICKKELSNVTESHNYYGSYSYEYHDEDSHKKSMKCSICGNPTSEMEAHHNPDIYGICVCWPEECRNGEHNCNQDIDAYAKCEICGKDYHINEEGDPMFCDRCNKQF